MYLQKLEIQGFKSFATRTVLEFPSKNGKGKAVTAVVGPNGSGKSNIADAIRWVLGEQSMKTLRGKKSDDVIFFGSDKKARTGMAEVSLYLSNEDGSAPIDLSELVITRRLYRNGDSEYLLNKQAVRLSDIQILLAKANFGQRTYSVIGQGMVDHFLVASQAERKEFFDEAAGVKEFQIKKNQTLNQLQRSRDNLKQTEITLQELGPRYRSLSRLVNRLEQRSGLEAELSTLQAEYYGSLWHELMRHYTEQSAKVATLETTLKSKQAAVATTQTALDQLEHEDASQDTLTKLQQEFTAAAEAKNKLREKQLKLQSEILRARDVARQQFVPVSADVLASELEALVGAHDELHAHVSGKSLDPVVLKSKISALLERLRQLLKKVKRPSAAEVTVDPQLAKDLTTTEAELAAADKQIAVIQQQMTAFSRAQADKKGAFFDLQRQFAAAQQAVNVAGMAVNDVKIELARLETRKEDLEREIIREMGSLTPVETAQAKLSPNTQTETVGKIDRLKRQLEQIGSIDDESLKEYGEIKERFEFLNTQFTDLTRAIDSLEEIIVELDKEIHQRFDATFQQINTKFGEYFQKLFGGGKAHLEKLMVEVTDKDDEPMADEDEEVTEELAQKKGAKKELVYGGVEIRACPPGKKISNLNTLSGGERAMTSIALICAIIACNPSPFVVLDEVDAALDEANSERYAAIVDELSAHTQFIVVTHNRASMRRAAVLYGVTMGDDSVSHLLSVKLEQGEQWAK